MRFPKLSTCCAGFIWAILTVSPAFPAEKSKSWYCSALLNSTDKKPTAFRFDQRGDRLIDSQLWENALWKRYLNNHDDKNTVYRIVDDSDIGLVAIHSETYVADADKKPTVWVETIAINKRSGEFVQVAFTTTERVTTYEGTCQQQNN